MTKIANLKDDGLYRVEKDADEQLWGLFAADGGETRQYDEWHPIDVSEQEAIEAGLMPAPEGYGANYGGV
jgi:hypothetical protein